MTSLLRAVRDLHITRRRSLSVCTSSIKKLFEYSWLGCRTFCDVVLSIDEMKNKLTDEQIQEKISEWKNGVDLEKLNDKEKVIHRLHLESLDVSKIVFYVSFN